MTAISIQVEGQNGLTWARWIALAAEVEELGFAGLFRSDHFTNARGPDLDALEMVVSLTWLASQYAPHPLRPARRAALRPRSAHAGAPGRRAGRPERRAHDPGAAGAGWQEREHATYGYDLGDVPTRMARFAEGLELVTRLLRDDEPVTFDGAYYPDARGAAAAQARAIPAGRGC